MIATLPNDLEKFFEAEVSVGHFASRDEVIAAALRMMQERHEKLAALRRDIAIGKEELDRGEGIVLETDEDVEAFVADIIARGEERLAKERQP